MPLDDFQASVLRVLMPLRSPESVFAGGTVLHMHGYRLSGDQDLFHASGADLVGIVKRDVAALKHAGFEVKVGKALEGLYEAEVGRVDEGWTKLQWVEAGSWNFFAPVPDPRFGWRLHMADIAINKVLAAGGRKQVRDYVDLAMLHRHVIPLWLAIWAAPGKDESWSPVSLAEKIARTNGFRQPDIDESVLSTTPISAAEVGATVREALEEALDIFPKLPDEHAGKLFVNQEGNPLLSLDEILNAGPHLTVLDAAQGGNWPSSPDIDQALIARVVEAYGWEGSKAAAEPPSSGWT